MEEISIGVCLKKTKKSLKRWKWMEIKLILRYVWRKNTKSKGAHEEYINEYKKFIACNET